ncbi:MAG: hypothetical protein WKF43_01940 [Acidimicrobiales bacterium]
MNDPAKAVVGIFDRDDDPSWEIGEVVTTDDGRLFKVTTVHRTYMSATYHGRRLVR